MLLTIHIAWLSLRFLFNVDTDIREFESSQKDESRAQTADSLKAYGKLRAFICRYCACHVLFSANRWRIQTRRLRGEVKLHLLTYPRFSVTIGGYHTTVASFFRLSAVADTLWSVHTRHETPICQESTMQNNTLSL